jgi:hypothetical protein
MMEKEESKIYEVEFSDIDRGSPLGSEISHEEIKGMKVEIRNVQNRKGRVGEDYLIEPLMDKRPFEYQTEPNTTSKSTVNQHKTTLKTLNSTITNISFLPPDATSHPENAENISMVQISLQNPAQQRNLRIRKSKPKKAPIPKPPAKTKRRENSNFVPDLDGRALFGIGLNS